MLGKQEKQHNNINPISTEPTETSQLRKQKENNARRTIKSNNKIRNNKIHTNKPQILKIHLWFPKHQLKASFNIQAPTMTCNEIYFSIEKYKPKLLSLGLHHLPGNIHTRQQHPLLSAHFICEERPNLETA